MEVLTCRCAWCEYELSIIAVVLPWDEFVSFRITAPSMTSAKVSKVCFRAGKCILSRVSTFGTKRTRHTRHTRFSV